MKRLCIFIAAAVLALAGCKDQNADSTQAPPMMAVIAMPDGTIVRGEVAWKRHGSDGIVSVEIDGKTYSTHLSNVVTILEE